MARKKRADIPFAEDYKKNVFYKSIVNLKTEDIPALSNRKLRKKRIGISGIIQYLFLGVCAVVLVVCLVLIGKNLYDKKRGEDIYSSAASQISPITIGDGTAREDKPSPVMQTLYDRINSIYGGNEIKQDDGSELDMDLSSIKASLSSLKQTNSDVIGWIYVEDSKINYPLMQSSNGNDEYYLTHAYNGEYRSVGSIYLTSACDRKLDNNFNSLIYGHNVVNGSMFHDVLKFTDSDFFNSKYIYIYTLDGAYIYKPFSVYQTKSDYNYIQTSFSGESEFLDFALRVASNTEVENTVEISEGDKIITLSTCTNGGVSGTGRYALHAKLVAFVEG